MIRYAITLPNGLIFRYTDADPAPSCLADTYALADRLQAQGIPLTSWHKRYLGRR
jgi:hypothetical protein